MYGLREHAPQIAHPALFRWYGDILWLNEGKLMIVRTWHGCVPLKHAEGYANHLQRTGVEHSRSIEGNRGAFVRRET